MKKLLFFFLVLISCQNRPVNKDKPDNIEIINLEKGYNKLKKVKLSEFVKSIDYIPLQSDSSCFIRRMNSHPENVEIVDNRIFIFDQRELLQFDIKGNFINKIGKKGKGPGEYNNIQDFTVIPDMDMVAIFSPSTQKLLLYSYNNEFIRSFKVKTWPIGLYSKNQELYFFSCKGRRDLTDFKAFSVYDLNGNLLKNFLSRDFEKEISKDGVIGLNSMHLRYLYHDTLSFWEFQYDTLYRFTDDYHAIPRFVITEGSNKLPIKTILEKNIKLRLSLKFAVLFRFIETDNYFLFESANKNRRARLFYNKNTKDIVQVEYKENNKLFQKFYNDIDSMLPLWPLGRIDDNRLWTYFYPSKLKDKDMSHIDILNSCSKEPTDNPVIVVLNLK